MREHPITFLSKRSLSTLLHLIEASYRPRIIAALVGLAGLVLVSVDPLSAAPPGGVGGKNLNISGSSTSAHGGALDLDSSFDPVLSLEVRDFNQYERRTIKQFEPLHEISQPRYDPEDPDLDRAEHAAQKAFLIQGSRAGSTLVRGSELYPLYQSIKRGLSEMQDSFRYSLQADSSALHVSRKRRGDKLLELNLEFNVSQGLDPQIMIADSVRFRYDIIEQRQILEYELDF